MPVSLYQEHNYGEFNITFGEKNNEPVMIIKRGINGKSKNAYVIFMGMAHKFADLDTGDRYLMETALKVAYLLDIGQNRSMVKKLADAILNHLEELIRMPPAPIPKLEQPEDVVLKIDGEPV